MTAGPPSVYISEIPHDDNNVETKTEKLYTYEEALDTAGNGKYNYALLGVMGLATLSMAMDLFGISVIIPAATCDFHLDLKKAGILLSVTFIGPVVMAYPWGYIADTQGRKRSLLISLWCSFVLSAASAFSTNWMCLAVLKLLSSSFSSCAQSVTFTLLGESSSKQVRDYHMLIIAGLVDLSCAFYVGIAYVILNGEWSIDIGVMTFGSWRCLTVALALPLGISAALLHLFHESPKFDLNMGNEEKALATLREIWKMNGSVGEYHVKSVVLLEEGHKRVVEGPFWKSLWEQFYPLWKPPLLWRSLQLYFLIAIIYSTNNGYYIWFPFLAQNFIKSVLGEGGDSTPGLCALIIGAQNQTQNMECTNKIDIRLFYAGLAEGVAFAAILLLTAKLVRSKRGLVTGFVFLSGVCAIAAVLVKDSTTSFVMFIGIFLNELAVGVIFSYYVDLYPTSYSGMAACLGTMVARGSALVATNLLGTYIVPYCAYTFYVTSGLMFCGVIVSIMLPNNTKMKL